MAGALGGNAKKCHDCGIVKPASEFWRRNQSPDGLALYCKECFGLRNAASYRGRLAAAGKEARTYRRHSAVPPGMKYCAKCGETKPLSEFGRNRANKSGLVDYCRPCHNAATAETKRKIYGSERSYLLMRRYGLTADAVAERQMVQLDRCLICRREATLHVDHDHATGKVRGLLCFNCNNGLGQFRDDPERLRRAADYLDGIELPYEAAGTETVIPGEEPAKPSTERLLRRHYKLTARYGIGLDEVERMIEEQGGVCPVCRSAAPRDVDHDHETGEVRGVL
ncbi:MAG TPA: endonuclease domain-containing protein, partial [Streptosporangiaceae bacterium]